MCGTDKMRERERERESFFLWYWWEKEIHQKGASPKTLGWPPPSIKEEEEGIYGLGRGWRCL